MEQPEQVGFAITHNWSEVDLTHLRVDEALQRQQHVKPSDARNFVCVEACNVCHEQP